MAAASPAAGAGASSPARAPGGGGGGPLPEACAVFFEPRAWSRRFGPAHFTVDMPAVGVDGGGVYALFNVRVRSGDVAWTLRRRYRELHAFAESLPAALGGAAGAGSPFPPKTFFRDVSPAFLEARRGALEGWLHALLRAPGACLDGSVRRFLELDGGDAPRGPAAAPT